MLHVTCYMLPMSLHYSLSHLSFAFIFYVCVNRYITLMVAWLSSFRPSISQYHQTSILSLHFAMPKNTFSAVCVINAFICSRWLPQFACYSKHWMCLELLGCISLWSLNLSLMSVVALLLFVSLGLNVARSGSWSKLQSTPGKISPL